MSEDETGAQREAVDSVAKIVTRSARQAVLRLLGMDVAEDRVRSEDTAVNVPEQQADAVLGLLGPDDRLQSAINVEYMVGPDIRELEGWVRKTLNLSKQLGVPVVLVVVYLQKGRRRTFPSTCVVKVGHLRMTVIFETVRLWEHEERIRRGDLRELTPLLLVTGRRLTEEDLRLVRDELERLDVPEEERRDLMATAVMLASRHFSREVIQRVFREVVMSVDLLEEIPILKELMQERIQQVTRQVSEQVTRQVSEQVTRQVSQDTARQMLLRALARRFREVPQDLSARIAEADVEWCEHMLERAHTVSTIDDVIS